MPGRHVGREVLIKLAPADRRDKLYQVVIRLDTTISTNYQHWNIYTEIIKEDGEVSPVNYCQSDNQLGYSNYIEIDY